MTFPRSEVHRSWSLGQWPGVDVSLLEGERRQRFESLKGALDAYLGGKVPAEVEAIYGVRRQEIWYYLKRCKSQHADGRLFGYRALIGYVRLGTYTRKMVCDGTEEQDGFGCAGAYQKLLRDFPTIERLIRAAVGGRTGRSTKLAGLHVMTLHKEILAKLRKEGVPSTAYPFNTKTAGYGSLCKHINALLDEGDVGAMRSKYGDAAINGQIAGTGKRGWLQAQAPLDLVCYDEYALAFIGVLVIVVNGISIEVPLQRCSLCLLVDEVSLAVLGYFISTRRRIAAGDVLAAVEHSVTPWKPIKLSIPNLRYAAGAGFPSGVIEGFAGRRIGILKVDNDLTHYATSVLNHLVERTGYSIQFGKVGRWITRQPVERVFAEMQKRHFRQLPSTTGSGPADTAVNDPVMTAVKHRIELHELNELVEVVLANYNASARRELMNRSPLERLDAHFSKNGAGTFIPTLSAAFLSDPRFPTDIFSCIVRGSKASGRRPYVELDRAHYTNPLLSRSWEMIGTKLIVHVHNDFRVLRAFGEDGQEFPQLEVTGHWSRSAHDRSTRSEINRLHREGELKFTEYEDPILVYQKYLAQKALAANRKKRPKVVREANKLARTLTLTGSSSYELPTGDSGGYGPNVLPLSSEVFPNTPPEPVGDQWRMAIAAVLGSSA